MISEIEFEFGIILQNNIILQPRPIEFTTLFQYILSDIATKRSSLAIEVSLQMVSGKVSFRDRLCDDGSLQRTKDDASLYEALEQCPANWTLRFIGMDEILGEYSHRWFQELGGSSRIDFGHIAGGKYSIHPTGVCCFVERVHVSEPYERNRFDCCSKDPDFEIMFKI